MTATFITARINSVEQFQNYPKMTLEEAESLTAEWYYIPSTGFWVRTKYKFIQIITCGWQGGARMRTKSLPLDKALTYVNKLHIGGWLDDDNYNTAYTLVDLLVRKETPEWEILPFDFRPTTCGDGMVSPEKV